MSDYRLSIDGREYQPIPDSWLTAGPAFDEDGDPEAVRLYAVSAAPTAGGRMLRIRYAHPRENGVLTMVTGAVDGSDGLVPAGLARNSSWARSILPTPRQEPDSVIRQPERDHFVELWNGRLDDLEADGRVAVADGGHPPIDPLAAEEVSEGSCQYKDCAQDADYRVEFDNGATTLMCDDCSQANHVWVRENGLLKREVSGDAK